jgi:hypothetical protein
MVGKYCSHLAFAQRAASGDHDYLRKFVMIKELRLTGPPGGLAAQNQALTLSTPWANDLSAHVNDGWDWNLHLDGSEARAARSPRRQASRSLEVRVA